MTLAVVSGSLRGGFDANINDNSGGAQILKAAENNDADALRIIAGRAQFTVEATTTTADTGSFANAVINLSAQGVTFPANTCRTVKVRIWSRGVGNILGLAEKIFTVTGGTNPVLGGAVVGTLDERNLGRIPVGGTTTTPLYVTPIVAVATTPTPDEVYVSLTTPTNGQDLRHYVEVELEPLRVIPAAVST